MRRAVRTPPSLWLFVVVLFALTVCGLGIPVQHVPADGGAVVSRMLTSA